MAPEKRRVLVTGANGFIGSHLVRRLEAEGFRVHPVTRRDADLTDRAQVSKVIESAQPDFLVHLASKAIPSRNLEEFDDYFRSSVQPALNLAICAPRSLRLAAFVGSCEEYGDSRPPFREEQRLESFSPYGWAKISAYYGVTEIARQRGLAWTWLRPFLTFGPGQRPFALIPSLVSALSRGESVALTPGEQTRDFIYVEDLCEMFVRVLNQPEKAAGKTFNLCSGTPRRVRDVAALVQKIVGKGAVKLGAIPYREREAMDFFGSTEAFTKAFGEVPLTDFERAIRFTLGER